MDRYAYNPFDGDIYFVGMVLATVTGYFLTVGFRQGFKNLFS